jgi:RimJ/RimL family protein N-acetyltransferase
MNSGIIRYIESRRLQLVPATVALTDADLAGHAALASALAAEVPENWPPEHYSRPALEYARSQLRDDGAQGWCTWYLMQRDQPQALLGVCGFKGRPDTLGSVEISYALLDQFHGQGLATEAVSRLVEWAFTQRGVREVSAETLPHLKASIRVLEKNGFQRAGAGSEYGVIRFALKRVRHY